MKKAFWILIGLLVASIAVNVWLIVRGPKVETTIETKHDTVWKDTIIHEPVAAETINTGRVVYIKIPMPIDTQGTGTAVPSKDSTGASQSPCVADSATIALPIMQKRYDDSLYTAWVSGYEPNLDSILIHQREITNTITITNTIVKPASRFAFGPSVGLGYGIRNKQTDVFVGVNATWNIWRK